MIEIARPPEGARTVWQVGSGRHLVKVKIERPGRGLRSFDIDNDDVNSLFLFLDLWRPFSADLSAWLDGAGRDLPWTYCDFQLDDLPERYRGPFSS